MCYIFIVKQILHGFKKDMSMRKKITQCLLGMKAKMVLPMSTRRKQIISSVSMLLAGILVIVSTNFYIPKNFNHQTAAMLKATPSQAELPDTADAAASDALSLDSAQKESVIVAEPDNPGSTVRLNMVYEFQEGADTGDAVQSIAGQTLSVLSERDSSWISGIYGYSSMSPVSLAEQLGRGRAAVLGQYNPQDAAQDPANPDSWTVSSWTNVQINFYDGDGNAINAYSNAKEILSMASVYAYRNGIEEQEPFLQYAEALWANSHRNQTVMSDVYYCDGSLDLAPETPEAESAEDGTLVSGEDAEGSQGDTSAAENAQIREEKMAEYILNYSMEDLPADWESITGPERDIWEAVVTAFGEGTPMAGSRPAGVGTCTGHVDLTVSAYISGFEENQGLYVCDAVGNQTAAIDGDWTGWDKLHRFYAKCIEQQDWNRVYGLSIVPNMLYRRSPLTVAETVYYMNLLPEDTSPERKLVVKQALESVGLIPYYWGGKPSAAGYEGNHFGTATSPDEDGRTLRGLDCSGWINWVYWSALGTPLPYQSTGGLTQCGMQISREELKAGDIMVKTGASAHVYLFLAWAGDDHMYVIHETTGQVDNVTVDRLMADWPYYRRLIND